MKDASRTGQGIIKNEGEIVRLHTARSNKKG